MNGKIVKRVLEFKETSIDKSALGVFNDVSNLIRRQGFPLSNITDNCSVMNSLSKHSEFIFKVFCLGHKLSIIKTKLHKNPFIANVDSRPNQVNLFFQYRPVKFNLSRTPPTSFSQTRPWRSHKLNYEIILQNAESYAQITGTDPTSPNMPSIEQVANIFEFEKEYCKNIDLLEESNSNKVSAISVYFNLIILARKFTNLNLEQIIIDELYSIVFCLVAWLLV